MDGNLNHRDVLVHEPYLREPVEAAPERTAYERDMEKRHAERLARNPGLQRLEAFVTGALASAEHMDNPIPFLRAQAVYVQAKLRALSAWAALPDDDDTPRPEDLQDLTTFDLSDALDRLGEAARRFERAA